MSMQWLKLSGDNTGQIYLTVPAHLVSPEAHERLWELLLRLDDLAWSCNGGEGTEIEVVEVGDHDLGSVRKGIYRVAGGMGGGLILLDTVWLDDDPAFAQVSDDEIRQILGLPRIPIKRGKK